MDGRVLICSASTAPGSFASAAAKSALSAASRPSPPNTTSHTAVFTPAAAKRRASSACTERRHGSGPTFCSDALSMPTTTTSGLVFAEGNSVSDARRWNPANALADSPSAAMAVTTIVTPTASRTRRSMGRRRTGRETRRAPEIDSGAPRRGRSERQLVVPGVVERARGAGRDDDHGERLLDERRARRPRRRGRAGCRRTPACRRTPSPK